MTCLGLHSLDSDGDEIAGPTCQPRAGAWLRETECLFGCLLLGSPVSRDRILCGGLRGLGTRSRKQGSRRHRFGAVNGASRINK